MELSPGRFNRYLIVKLPSAWICGVRVKEIAENSCRVGVKHRWINQNPFKSIYFAVQAMAAELSTGALVINQVNKSGRKISMLVAQNKAMFLKKATGRIVFICNDGHKAEEAITKILTTGEGETFWMKSTGINGDGVEVSVFEFEWTVRVKKK